MYNPTSFTIHEKKTISHFLRQNGFALMISRDGASFHDTHTPLVVNEDLTLLSGHVARANPQWQSWKSYPSVKVIFHGPHAYISPRYYVSDFNVPTWNYTAVSIDGTIRVLEDREKQLQIINGLITQYEGEQGWKLDTSDSRYLKLFEAIVCFEIQIDRIEAKFKLNQNKSTEDKNSVIAHLEKSVLPGDRAVADFMKHINKQGTL